jgi:lipopolysaccharide export system permease protein
MGKTLFRYVALEVVTPFILGVFIFTFVLLMFQILKIAEMVVNYGVGLGQVLKIVAYILPPFFVITVPMAFLLAVMLAVSRLSADSELTAMKAGGISLIQMVPPVILIGAITTVLTFGLTLVAEPWGKQGFKKMLFELGRSKATLGLSERVFNEEFDGLTVYVNKIHPEIDTLEGVFIEDVRNPGAANVIVASKGRIVADESSLRLVLRLIDGAIHRTGEGGKTYESIGFGKYDMVLDFSKVLSGQSAQTSYLEMGVSQLGAFVQKMRLEKPGEFETRRAHVEYHRRFAFPFACLMFSLLGLPLGIAPPRSGKSRGFTIAIAVICLYYLMFRVGENLGWKGVAHPIVVMWTPNLILGVLGAWLLYIKANERPIKSIEFLGWQYERASIWLGKKFEGKNRTPEKGER